MKMNSSVRPPRPIRPIRPIRPVAAVAALAALVASPVGLARPAHAELGRTGTTALEAELDLDMSAIRTTDPDGDRTSTDRVAIAASASRFVGARVSVSLTAGFARQATDDDPAMTQWRASAGAGYHLRLAPRLGLWPRFALGYARTGIDTGTPSRLDQLGLSVYVPFVFEPAPHVLIGWGPVIGAEVYARYTRGQLAEDASKSRLLGVAATLGGWF